MMRPGAALLLAVALAGSGCAEVQFGDRDSPPVWRRPGPALLEPQPRIRLPDDGFRDHLAASGAGARTGAAA